MEFKSETLGKGCWRWYTRWDGRCRRWRIILTEMMQGPLIWIECGLWRVAEAIVVSVMSLLSMLHSHVSWFCLCLYSICIPWLWQAVLFSWWLCHLSHYAVVASRGRRRIIKSRIKSKPRKTRKTRGRAEPSLPVASGSLCLCPCQLGPASVPVYLHLTASLLLLVSRFMLHWLRQFSRVVRHAFQVSVGDCRTLLCLCLVLRWLGIACHCRWST